jgi:hypothetical protein
VKKKTYLEELEEAELKFGVTASKKPVPKTVTEPKTPKA